MRRLILSGMAVAGLSVPLATVVMTPAANANSGITCSKIKGTPATSLAISSCKTITKAAKPTHKTLGTSSVLTLATGGTLTWNGGATVTIGAATFTAYGVGGVGPIPAGQCPKSGSQNEYVASAPVTAGDGVVALTGDTFTASICTDKKGKFYVSPGTKIAI